jgi:RNA polymerase sigma-70 factor (ECF subfamily)
MQPVEANLVEQAKSGDRAAFEELVRRTSRLVYSRLLLETGDRHRAEDLLQETYLSAYRALANLKDASGLRTWLLTIARNTLTDAVRRDSARKRGGGVAPASDLSGVADPAGQPAEAAEREERRQRVVAVLQSLPEEYRQPLSLRYLAGADFGEIETQLGLTNGALRGMLHRGLKLLRDRLGPDFA